MLVHHFSRRAEPLVMIVSHSLKIHSFFQSCKFIGINNGLKKKSIIDTLTVYYYIYFTHTHTQKHTHTHTHTHTHIYTYIHIYIYTYIHTHIYTSYAPLVHSIKRKDIYKFCNTAMFPLRNVIPRKMCPLMVLLPYELLGPGICDNVLAPDSEVGKAAVKASIIFTCVLPSDATPSVSRFTKSVHLLQNYECRTNGQNKHKLKATYSLCTP